MSAAPLCSLITVRVAHRLGSRSEEAMQDRWLTLMVCLWCACVLATAQLPPAPDSLQPSQLGCKRRAKRKEMKKINKSKLSITANRWRFWWRRIKAWSLFDWKRKLCDDARAAVDDWALEGNLSLTWEIWVTSGRLACVSQQLCQRCSWACLKFKL